jgi:hypothetical protein
MENSITIKAKTNLPGILYYLVKTETEAFPEAQEIINTCINSFPVGFDNEASTVVYDLLQGTNYIVYMLAQDNNGNSSEIVAKPFTLGAGQVSNPSGTFSFSEPDLNGAGYLPFPYKGFRQRRCISTCAMVV